MVEGIDSHEVEGSARASAGVVVYESREGVTASQIAWFLFPVVTLGSVVAFGIVAFGGGTDAEYERRSLRVIAAAGGLYGLWGILWILTR